MAGSGTKVDPWLIESSSQLATLLRTPAGGGYYKLTGDFTVSLTNLGNTAAQSYSSKIIDAAGYLITISLSVSASVSCVLAGITLVNGFLSITVFATGQYTIVELFVNCFFTDCLLLLRQYGAYQSYMGSVYSAFVSPEPKEFRRVVVMGSYTGVDGSFNNWSIAPGITFTDVFKFTSGANGTWYTARSTRPTVPVLDSLTSGRFTAAGWFDDASLPAPRPFFADVINLVVNTIVAGEPKARSLFYEAGGQFYSLGQSSSAGLLELTLRVRRWLTFRVVATESYALDRLQSGNYVTSGAYYLPPVDNGWKYQASASGQMINLQSVTFGSSPVTVNGVTLTPYPVYTEMASPRTSLQTGGPQQIFTLDTASLGGGGGGPVLEGDPALLDGVVEEIHPLLGTVRPLANAEVVVVELREDQSYAPLGRTLSNQQGEFRVETEVYGGGDVFAFAVDFPGFVWQAGAELGLGARVRPVVNNGYVYEVITAGVAGASEPNWWADQGDGTEGYIGTARAKARPYYQPQAHGPLKMTLVTP